MNFTHFFVQYHFLTISRDTATGYYSGYQSFPDSLLADYHTNLTNGGLWFQYEIYPIKNFKLIAGIRYDYLRYGYHNLLSKDAYSGVPDTNIINKAWSPKVGAIYSFDKNKGIYANYSRGLSAPQASDLFFGKKVPDLQPAYFDSYEIGGWAAFWKKRIYIDISIYQMNGYNEIIRYKLPDNSTEKRNAGETLHRGIEYSLTITPIEDFSFRFGGTNAVHKYIDYNIEEEVNGNILNFDGNIMPEAPRFIANSEITYKPKFINGLRLSLEWERISPWYKDETNYFRYEDRTFLFKGISLLNFRTGYQLKNIEVYMNIINLTNELYANSATMSSSGTTFSAGAPRTFTFGLNYHFEGS